MGCWYRPKANQLWSIWYCLIVSLVHAYLLYVAVCKYDLYVNESTLKHTKLYGDSFAEKTQILADFDGSEDPYSLRAKHRIRRGTVDSADYRLVTFVALNGAVLALMPFFVASSCLKVGNLANDGDRMGARSDWVVSVSGFWLCRKLKSAWQHGPPTAQTLHLLMAFLILLADTLTEAQFFRQKVYNKEHELWSTDLDFIFEQHSKNENRQKVFAMTNNSGYGGYAFSHHMSSNAPPPHASIPGQRPKYVAVALYFNAFGLSIDFLNYLLALLIFSAVYPSTFWRANKWFGFLFSCHLIINALASIFAYVGFKLLCRAHHFDFVQWRGHGAYGPTPPSTKSANDPTSSFLLNDFWLVILYVATLAIAFASSTVVYGYGYSKFCIGLWIHNSKSRLRGQKTYTVCCEGYAPHISAIAALLLMVGCKSPFLYDEMMLYHSSVKPIVLACVVSDVVYLFCWILLWLVLTLLRDWRFKTSHTVGELCRMEGLRVIALDHTSGGGKAAPFSERSGLFLMCGDEMYATDEEPKKAALMRLAEKCSMGQREDDIYWLKPHGSDSVGEARKRKQSSNQEANFLLSPNCDQSPQSVGMFKKSQLSEAAYYKSNGTEKDGALASPKAIVRYPSHRVVATSPATANSTAIVGSTMTPGTYVRFNDDNALDHSHDVVTTFGTLPRQPNRQYGGDQSIETSAYENALGKELYSKQLNYKPMLNRNNFCANEQENLAYASVHKRNSPSRTVGPFPAVQTLSYQQQGCLQDDSVQNVSRGSSYVNVSSLHANKPQNLWAADVGSLGRPLAGQHTHNLLLQQRPNPTDRQPSYSSIQSQQLAAAYASTCSPNSHVQRRQGGTSTSVDAATSLNGSSERQFCQNFSPSPLEKSPTSCSNPSSKMSSFSDAGGDETATISRVNKRHIYDSTVTLVENSPKVMSLPPSGIGRVNSLARPVPKSTINPQQHHERLASWQANPVFNQPASIAKPSNVLSSGYNVHLSPPKPPLSGGTLHSSNGVRGSGKFPPTGHSKNGSFSNNLLGYREKSDSANFSLTSSNESENQYITSIV